MGSTVSSGVTPTEPAHGQLVVDVLRQVGGVEGEHQAPSPHRLVEVDDEALVPRRVSGGEHGRDAGGELGVPVGQVPLDGRVVEVDAEDGVVLGRGMVGEAECQLGPLGVHGYPAGEVAQPAGVVVVEVADRHPGDLVHADAGVGQRLLQRLPRAGQDRAERRVAVEPPPQRRVPDQRRVEPGVEQQPATVALEQHAGHRFP